MTATPSSAQPGQPISVTLSVLGANGPITDPATLSQMQVAVSVSGDGLSGPTEIPVSNAGETSGTSTGVGDYKGTFTAPCQNAVAVTSWLASPGGAVSLIRHVPGCGLVTCRASTAEVVPLRADEPVHCWPFGR